MRKRHLSRRLIGLLAAYLVALQALILPLSMPAVAQAGGLCITARDDSAPAHLPTGQDHGCPCAAGCTMQCHAPALATGGAASLPMLRIAVAAVLVALTPPALPAPLARGAQMPRGPPAA
jgi:hypothetical protein